MANVRIVTTPMCPYCMKVKDLLSSLGAEYEEINAIEQPEVREKLSAEHNWMTVPMIFIGDEFVGGYDDLAKLHAEGELQAKLGL